MSDFTFLLLLFVPIILLGVWAGFVLKKKKAHGGTPNSRSDATERPELTGTEQHKHRRLP